MGIRADSAATTRADLLRAAAELLDEGGPGAVTLRAVGARAGVSRGAPYGHFLDKDHLLTQLVVDAWTRLGDMLVALQGGHGSSATTLEAALMALLDLARTQPHLYALMWRTPAGDPGAILEAAGRSQDIFLTIVAEVVGREDARRYGALLMSSAHGIASMDLSGHLSAKKWDTSPRELVAMLVRSISAPAR
jgi:AcrR family transcriptional regulator